MKSFAWLRARPRTLASAGAVTAAAVAITTMAMVYQGYPTTEVDLHDGGVWVTKKSSLLVGHFNHESKVLDGGLRTTGDEYDILQSGGTVLVVDDAGSTVTPVDPALVSMTSSVKVPGGAKTVLGGSTVAILERSKGTLWAMPAKALGAFAPETAEPVTELGAGADVAVGADGRVFAVAPESGEVVSVTVGGDGEVSEPSRTAIDELDESAVASITAVGDTAVVLDEASGALFSTGGLRTEVPGALSLQTPSAASPTVAVATAGTLVTVPLDGSEPAETSTGAQGVPTAPVALDGCLYGAWSESAMFVRDCLGEADDVTAEVPGVPPGAELVFRVNRDVIVLNDIVGGAAWMASEDLQKVDNWSDITPPESDSDETDEETTDQTVETSLPKRSEVNTPPVANDDDFGVRPGRTTVLPVLDNDSDADGDVLTVTLPDGDPSLGPVQPINNGAGLQIAVPDDATGSASFTYEADDGRGGKAEATARLTVHDWDVNEGPKQNRITTVSVESGGVVTYNVLPDWIDPDGDDVFLKAVVPAEGDEADFTSDGRITYRAVGGTQGRKDVVIMVSDGEAVTEGTVRFDVRPPGTIDPVTNADHVVTRAGESVTVSPLANDVGTGREPLRLARVDDTAGAVITTDFANGTFAFRADEPGVYYVQYLVAAGAAGVPGIVRVDVLAEFDEELPPIAVRDVALLPTGGETLVDVLANDSDPAGGILVIQSVTVDAGTGISVAVLGHETLRISDQGSLAEQVTVHYTISNGRHSAQGDVIVIPVPAPSKLRPPVANDDQVVVRAGDVVTIPVLDNDYHPNGDTLHVAPDLVEPIPAADAGEIFVSQDAVRFRASDEPGTVYATYEAVDSTGQKDAGYVTIQVLPVNPETNQAPRARDLTARVLTGSNVTITVPLDGIDPDGDSVELAGIASAPKKGRIVEVGADTLKYEAVGDAVGVDAFTYRVRDRLGAESTATVRIGIAPGEAVNQAPYAVKDSTVMRPGRIVAVPVTANDSDPDGDAIVLVRNGLVVPDVPGLSADVVGDRVVVTAPDEPMETSLQYTIRDERGAEAIAVLQITVDEDVPLLRPVARDDRVRAQDVEEGAVEVDVLANDEDPDGTVDALDLDVRGTGVRVVRDGVVSVELGDEPRLVSYTITDRDGLAATAFVHVPALDQLPPTVLTAKPVVVGSGETIELPLKQYVSGAEGKQVVITEAAKVSAMHADGAPLVKDQQTLVYTSADRYFGEDALTFEVTDGTGPDDPTGRKATLTIPITVLPPENQQPSFLNGQMSVAPGEDATSLDLRALTTDPDPEDLDGMSYTLAGGAPAGFSAQLDGGTLQVSAASDTPKATQVTLKVRVDDGHTEPVEGSIVVTVTASTRPLATANDDVLDEAHQGTTVRVPVLDNDFNPFPDTPLTLVTAIVETGMGDAEPDGDQVAVMPRADFVGTMVVRYRIQDATKDADREVEGRITVTVQGVPEAPGTPTVSSEQDRTVVLSWTPPADNGAEITSYTVSSTRGDYTKTCQATTCTLDGLTNNVEYNFTVVATNRVGDGPASRPSETARPDARPDTPQAPTFTAFGDRSLTVAWVTPTTPGSPVEKYTLEISPAPPSGLGQKTEVTGNSLVWDGLENGVAYQVKVQAHNRAPDPSSWSAWSATEIPAKAPDPVAAPSVNRLAPVPPQAQLEVLWAQPAINGDDIDAYEVQVLQGGTVVRTVSGIPGTQTSQALAIDTSTSDYTFRVRALNKAGWGEFGDASAPRRAFVAPGAPTITGVTPQDRKLKVAYTPAPGNGATASELRYEYSLNGGGWQSNWDGSTIGGLANGTNYRVAVRAYTSLDGVRYDGAASAQSAAQTPFGPVNTPGASASVSGTRINFSWSAPAANGRAITKMEIAIQGVSGWHTVALNGSESHDFGHSATRSIQVRATDAVGQVSAVKTASATTVPRPQPTATVSKGRTSGSMPNCSNASCGFLRLTVTNFPAGRYFVACSGSGEPRFAGRNYDIPENGSVDMTCYYGFPGREVWLEIDGWGSSSRMTWY